MDQRVIAASALGAAAVIVLIALARPRTEPAPARVGPAPVAPPDAGLAPSSTETMAALLARLAREVDPETDSYENVRRLEARRRKPLPADPRLRFAEEASLAIEQMLAGEAAEAAVALDALVARLEADPGLAAPEVLPKLYHSAAIAHLRRGEQDNCVALHHPEACLLPLAPSAIHVHPDGSRAAIERYRAILARDPDDLSARWLLNLASMTLGKWPQDVPRAALIPPAAFAAEADLGRFPNVATAAKVDRLGLAGGVVLEDLDGDGLLDLMLSSWGPEDQLRFLRNDGDGRFTDRTEAAGLLGVVGGLNLVHADYDNDGDADVLVLRGAWRFTAGRVPNSLLRNDGGGRFTDVTVEAGLLSFHPTQTAAWADFDGDGWLDLFIGNESGYASFGPDDARRPLPAGDAWIHRCELYRNRGDGTFVDVAHAAGVDFVGFVKGVVAGDIDDDGLPDLYVSRLDGENLLLRNLGSMRFSDISRAAGVREPIRSFPTWLFDYDGDGRLDLFVSSYGARLADVAGEYLGVTARAGQPRLYRNLGGGRFEDVTERTRLARVIYAMGANFGDLDNDGWLDFYVGTGDPSFTSLMPNRMFRNVEGQRFAEVTSSGGFGHLQKGHAVAFGDIDHDGDQDVYAVMGGAYSADVFRNALFLNPGHGRRFIELNLVGRRANRSAIGAKLAVRVRSPRGERTIRAHVSTGGSFGSSPLRRHIGLGDATEIVSVEIVWPLPGDVQTLEGLALDTRYGVVEGEAPVPLSRPRIPLGVQAPD